MKIKIFLMFIFLTINLNIQAQIITKDSIQIQIVKNKQVDNSSVIGIRSLKIKSDVYIKIMIKAKILSEPNNRTKLSAFSLLDTVNKIRYRLADYKGYRGIIGAPELIPFLKTRLLNKKGKDYFGAPRLIESEIDYFDLFDKDGYTNFELPVNFGTKKNPKISVVYFGETEYRKFTAELFFAIIKIHKYSDFELYYKDERVTGIKLTE